MGQETTRLNFLSDHDTGQLEHLAAGLDARLLQVLQVHFELDTVVIEDEREMGALVNRMACITDQ